MAEQMTGRCLCGAITFKAALASHDVSSCHCGMCRRWTGGPLMYVDVIGAPSFEGQQHIRIYRSSESGERGFCGQCGSALFWKVAGEDHYTLTAGSLDDCRGLSFTKEIFIEDQPAFYEFANRTEKLKGADAMLAYGAAQDHTD